MADILSLRGRTALSPFRLAKLLDALAAARPDHRISGITATYWHFAEVARPLTPGERDKLERLLDYGPRAADVPEGRGRLLVVPRLGTISPWSSKATDIAHICGLAPWCASSAAPLFTFAVAARCDAGDRDALLPLAPRPDDRGRVRRRRRSALLFAHVRAAAADDDPAARRRPRGARRRRMRRSASRSPTTRSTTSRGFPRARPRSDRRRADDVRAGELRALPPQDLQRRLGHRRRAAAARACSR